jgi:hypothetical protein
MCAAALELRRHLGVCYKSAWLIKHKLMEVMREREASRVLDGRVEIDDAYLGGELPGGKTGRGSRPAPTTPSISPSTRIATSLRSSTDSIVASIWPPSWRAYCAPLPSPRLGLPSTFARLR